jgi:uncharacterized protein (TIGR03545 family)
MKVKIFRWKAIGPLLLLFAILGFLVWLFAEPVVRDTTEEASSELLGTQVDLGKLDLIPRQASVELRALQIADPFVLTRNLVEADNIRLKLNPSALAEKKLVIENLNLSGMRFGTMRKTPARPQKANGFAPQVYRSVQQWAGQFDVPLLSLTPIDTVRQLVLNPAQLTTVREAQALATRTDSTRKALERNFQQLDIRSTVDSARQLADRLAATDPKKLGVEGTRQAIESVRKALKEIDGAKQQIGDLDRNVRSGVEVLGQGLKQLDNARAKDFAFAKSLLKLPTFAAPEIGSAFFGKVSIDRFKQALYWAELAQKYMPPGLLPRPTPGPKRLRAAGSTIEFPRLHEFPSFLVEQGRLDFSIGSSPVQGAYSASVSGLTSAPALYGRPAIIKAERRAAGSAIGSIDVAAVINHVSSRTRDSADARLERIKLPSFDVPGVPFRVAPGVGSSTLSFSMRNGGADILGRWTIQSNQVTWLADTTGHPLNQLERIVFEVVSGLKDLRVAAAVSGSVREPKLSVSSNLDKAISQRLQAVVGQEVAKAERMARAKVDSLVADKVTPVKQQITGLQSEATHRVQAQKQQLDEAETRLNAELKRWTGGLAPGIELPKIKL